jgi:hypothetical protein
MRPSAVLCQQYQHTDHTVRVFLMDHLTLYSAILYGNVQLRKAVNT